MTGQGVGGGQAEGTGVTVTRAGASLSTQYTALPAPLRSKRLIGGDEQ